MEDMEKEALETLGPVPSSLEEFHHDIEMRDGYKSTLKVIKPRNAAPGPLVVLVFGGGFIGGSKDQLVEEARALAQMFGATVVNISYRLNPEHKFPIPQLDAWDNMKWIAENATGRLLNADPSKGFLMGGVSAGASITAVLSRKFQEEELAHPLTGQWLAVPPLFHEDIVPQEYRKIYISADRNATPGMTKEERMKRREAGGWDMSSDLAFAGNSKTPMSAQPRTYFQVDGQDPMRDDALVYDEMLKEAGVSTKVDFYPGCPHAHWAMMAGIEITDRARIDSIVGLAWLLGKSVSREEVAQVLNISM